MEEQKEFTPKYPKPRKLYMDIEMHPVVGGWIVQVGCRKIVYPDTPAGQTDMVHDLRAYLDDPQSTEKSILSRNISLNHAPVTPGCARPENYPDNPLANAIRTPAFGEIRAGVAYRTPEETAARDAQVPTEGRPLR